MDDDPIRLLLVDDHDTLRGLMADALALQPGLVVVGQAGSLGEARALLAAGVDADVALVDLDLPDGSGLDLIRDLSRLGVGVATLVLTGSQERVLHGLAIEAGASGVLPKTTPVAEIVAAVRRLCAGESLVDPREAAELLALAGRHREQGHAEREALARLTAREREVLVLLAEGLDNRALADRLYVSVPTARSHVVHLLAKLRLDSRLQAALLAVRHGIGQRPR